MAEVHTRRRRVWEVIKQLKEKNIEPKSPFPAQLRIHLESGTKTFFTLADAIPTLKELGIHIQLEDREELLKELMKDH
ncbi:hypothetical protein LDENG_00061540 [Lucifuga dentata]|nr:hypothetical protein LDENG_00061540 [Lucifuga dentata]